MSFLFVDAVEFGDFTYIKSWLSWSANTFGLIAICSYGIGRILFARVVWLFILLFYICVRIYELIPYGLVPADTDLYVALLICIKYTYLVAPSFLCLFYLWFFHNTDKAS